MKRVRSSSLSARCCEPPTDPGLGTLELDREGNKGQFLGRALRISTVALLGLSGCASHGSMNAMSPVSPQVASAKTGSSGKGEDFQSSSTKRSSASKAAADLGQANKPRLNEALRKKAERLTVESGWERAFSNFRERPDSASVPPPEPLSTDEWASALQGWLVAKPLSFKLEGRRYVGGASFQIIEAESDDILEVLMNENEVPEAVPLVRQAVQLDVTPSSTVGAAAMQPREVTLALEQGNIGMYVRYSVRLTRVDPHTIEFELDQAQAHDIQDVRGYITAHPLNETHSLVTFFVGLDLHDGMVGSVMRRRVQRVALTTPAHLRRYIEPIAEQKRIQNEHSNAQRLEEIASVP